MINSNNSIFKNTKKICDIFSTIINEPSNKGQIIFRIFISIVWQIYKRTIKFPIILPLDNGLKYIANPKAVNATGLIYTRIYESQYIEFLRKNLVENAYMIDVGAHTGLYTLLLNSNIKRAICFEPDPSTFILLRNNLNYNNLTNIIPILAALSNENKTGKLLLTGLYAGTTRLINTIPLPDETCIDVKLARLDDVLTEFSIEKIDFLKIDTEGHELEVILGAQNILKASNKLLILYENSNFDKIHPYLNGLGYKIFSINLNGEISIDNIENRRAYNLFAVAPGHPLYSKI